MTVGISHLVHHQLNSIKEYFKFQTTHHEKGHEFCTTSLPPTIQSVSAAEEVQQIHGRMDTVVVAASLIIKFRQLFSVKL